MPGRLNSPSVAVGSFPTVVSRTPGSQGNGTSFTVPVPAGAQELDMMLVSKTSRFGGNDTWPGGWTSILASNPNSDVTCGGRYKILTSGDISAGSITVQKSYGGMSGWVVYLIRGASTAEGTGYISGWNPPSFSPSWGAKNNLWIAVCANYGAWLSTFPSPNYSNPVTGGQEEAWHWSCDRELNAASEDPPTYVNFAGGSPVSGTIAVQPSDALGPPAHPVGSSKRFRR